MRARLIGSWAIVLAACGCANDDGVRERLASSRQAISGAQVLEFESTSPWSAGGTTLALDGAIKQQGDYSLKVTTPSEWRQISAGNLTTIGTVSDKLSLDLRIDKQHDWGTLQLAVNLPSKGLWNTHVGQVSLAGRPVNTFFRVEFPLSPELKSKLAGYYDDLELRFTISAPAAVYHFDNGSFAGVPSPLASADIGVTGAPGGYTQIGNGYVIESAGEDVENDADSFHFLYRSLSGDGQVVARLDGFDAQNSWAKVGLMIRDSLQPGAKNAFMLLRPELGSAFQFREQNDGFTVSSWQDETEQGSWEQKVRWLRLPKWLKLIRQGDVITAYASNDGLCWGSEIWRQTLPFDDSEAYFGVAVSAGGSGTVSATVSELSVQGVVEPVNAHCDRAAVDGDFPWSPVESDWIVAPARFASTPPTWNYTTVNPNGATSVEKCDPNEIDDPSRDDGIVWRKDGPDHPNCPDPNVVPAWTTVNFAHNTPGWQFNEPAGFGIENVRTGDKVSTVVDARNLWLRKTFTLSSQAQKDDLVLWGRWSEGITIYINGALATSVHGISYEHRYLGLSDEARAALNVGGTNVIAVRLEWERYAWDNGVPTQFDAWERYFDLGITTNEKLANLPTDRWEATPALEVYTDTFREFMHELGISGATLAVRKDGQTVVKSGIGYRDKDLTQQMPSGAILRLASVDKVITNAAIVKLIQDGVIEDPYTPVFDLLRPFPVPELGKGEGVEAITVEHLRTHTSGIGHLAFGDQAGLDEMAFKFGIGTNEWTKHHMASWLYSQPVTDFGDFNYSNDGYALLRYVVERVTGKSLNDYLEEDMGLSEIVVSGERLADRQVNSGEYGYITHQEPWDRWAWLDETLALSASAEGLTKFFDDYALGYALENGTYVPGGGLGGGAMAGTWSVVVDIPDRNLAWAVIANSIGGFDHGPGRLIKITEDTPCLFGFEDPRTQPDKLHFIQNVAQPTWQLHNEDGALVAAPAKAHWWGAQWYPEPVSGTSYFRLRNRGSTAIDGTPRYLTLVSGTLQVSAVSPSTTDAHWELLSVSNSTFRIRNRASSSSYLHVQDGTLAAGPIQSSWTSARWNFCD